MSAIRRCRTYRQHFTDDDPVIAAMAYDAVLRNLAVIGEAVKALGEDTKASAPDIPWASIAGLRNVVVHEYFRIDPDTVIEIVDAHLAALDAALENFA
jgi:uncharacterized protein with HEPN domain